MASKVSVEGEAGHLKRHVAARLVRRGWAEWKQEGVSIRRLAERKFTIPETEEQEFVPGGICYIPEKLPPAEVPNVKFIAPPVKDAGDQGAYFGV